VLSARRRAQYHACVNSTSSHPGRLNGKVAVITGAGASGKGMSIGRALAACFAQEGARVFALDIDRASLEETVALVKGAGGHITPDVVDVGDADAVAASMRRCMETCGRLDVLVNNVGISGTGGAAAIALDEWERLLAVNVGGALHACRAVLPLMEEGGGGAIVNISSLLSRLALRRIANVGYSVSKAALEQLTRVIAVEYAPRRIRANNLVLGLIDTPQVRSSYERRRALQPDAADRIWASRSLMAPLERQGTPFEVAKAAAFLASDDASYITGADLRIDGGLALLLD
jgi:NAD(P)-dependent dehydrogenase (short-subunit alcohol dehydrogenase family)